MVLNRATKSSTACAVALADRAPDQPSLGIEIVGSVRTSRKAATKLQVRAGPQQDDPGSGCVDLEPALRDRVIPPGEIFGDAPPACRHAVLVTQV
jgi:hypothetical protein